MGVTRDSCTTDAQCLGVFGLGSTCNANTGFCEIREGECTNAQDCQGRLGFGYTCAPTLQCQPIEVSNVHARCEKTFPTDLFENANNYRDYVVFGSLFDRNSSVHRVRENGVETGLVIINEAGGFTDRDNPAVIRRFATIFCDIHGGESNPYKAFQQRPDAAQEAADWLVNTVGVPVILGPPSSGDSQQVFENVIDPAMGRTVMITPAGTSPNLSALDPPNPSDQQPGRFWRTAESAATQVPVLAAHMRSIGVFKVGIIRETGAFGEGVAQAFIDEWTRTNRMQPEETVTLATYSTETSLTDAIVLALNGAPGSSDTVANSDAILFVGQTRDHQNFVQQISVPSGSTTFPSNKPIYFPHSGANDSVFSGALAAGHTRLFTGIRATVQVLPKSSVTYVTFASQHMRRFAGEDPGQTTFVANSYDALWIAALGSVWANRQEGDADHNRITGLNIARGIRRLVPADQPNPSTVTFTGGGWAQGVSKFGLGERVDAVGASSSLDFNLSDEELMGGEIAILEGQLSGSYRTLP